MQDHWPPVSSNSDTNAARHALGSREVAPASATSTPLGIFEIALRLGRLYGLEQIVTIGVAPTTLPVTRGSIRLVHFADGTETRRGRPRYPVDEEWTWDFSGGRPLPISPARLRASVLVCHEALEVATSPAGLLAAIRLGLNAAPVALLTLRADLGAEGEVEAVEHGNHLERFEARLREAALPPTFIGWTATESTRPHKTAALAIVDRVVGASSSSAPEGFTVTAVVTTYNEADVIAATIETLLADGVSVHVIDNWSTDGTADIVERFIGRGVLRLERFPEAPTAIYDWTGLLNRVEEVATEMEADWVIHHDADERPTPPWPGMTLRDGLWAVDRSGFNAVDHTVLNFRPIDNGFLPGSRPEDYFQHFEFGASPDQLLKVKAWKRVPGVRVDLVSSGGHNAAFPGRRVFPYKFVLKHYPIRSQAHGERKVFIERVARWNPLERAKGWHVQYDSISSVPSFLADPDTTPVFASPGGYRTFLAEIVAGAGLVADGTPSWAHRSHLARLAYVFATRALVRSGFSARAARRLGYLPRPIRDGVIAVKRRWLGSM